MKQRITVDQLNELSEEQKVRLRELWEPKQGDLFTDHRKREDVWLDIYPAIKDDGDLPLLNIGQCIELIRDQGPVIRIDGAVIGGWEVFDCISKIGRRAEELIDALWETVKEAL